MGPLRRLFQLGVLKAGRDGQEATKLGKEVMKLLVNIGCEDGIALLSEKERRVGTMVAGNDSSRSNPKTKRSS